MKIFVTQKKKYKQTSIEKESNNNNHDFQMKRKQI